MTNPPSPNEALREALDLVFRIEAAGVIMCEAENFERWKETARRIAPTLREADADAYGRTGEREDCFACNGSGQEYGETCLTCGGFGWTRLDAPSLSPSSGEPEAYYADDEPLSAEDQARIDAAWEKHKAADPVCRIPPEGWSCSRAAGHEGPCAASPSGEPASVAVEAKPWYETDAHRDLSRIIPDMEGKIADAKTRYAHCLPDHLFAPLEASITELRVLRHEVAAQPTPVEAGLREACEGIDADYMTSEAHHPGYVLIPTVKFDAIVAALSETLPPPSQEGGDGHD